MQPVQLSCFFFLNQDDHFSDFSVNIFLCTIHGSQLLYNVIRYNYYCIQIKYKINLYTFMFFINPCYII